MKLRKKAINKIKEQAVRLKLALALNFSEQWILKVIAANKPNGPLTTATALRVIKEETGMTESEVLEDESVGALK